MQTGFRRVVSLAYLAAFLSFAPGACAVTAEEPPAPEASGAEAGAPYIRMSVDRVLTHCNGQLFYYADVRAVNSATPLLVDGEWLAAWWPESAHLRTELGDPVVRTGGEWENAPGLGDPFPPLAVPPGGHTTLMCPYGPQGLYVLGTSALSRPRDGDLFRYRVEDKAPLEPVGQAYGRRERFYSVQGRGIVRYTREEFTGFRFDRLPPQPGVLTEAEQAVLASPEPADAGMVLGHLTVSPKGGRIAFAYNPSWLDGLPDEVFVIDLQGHVVARTRCPSDLSGGDVPIGWLADGDGLVVRRTDLGRIRSFEADPWTGELPKFVLWCRDGRIQPLPDGYRVHVTSTEAGILAATGAWGWARTFAWRPTCKLFTLRPLAEGWHVEQVAPESSPPEWEPLIGSAVRQEDGHLWLTVATWWEPDFRFGPTPTVQYVILADGKLTGTRRIPLLDDKWQRWLVRAYGEPIVTITDSADQQSTVTIVKPGESGWVQDKVTVPFRYVDWALSPGGKRLVVWTRKSPLQEEARLFLIDTEKAEGRMLEVPDGLPNPTSVAWLSDDEMVVAGTGENRGICRLNIDSLALQRIWAP
jgi:hypothetical protein